MNFTRAAEICNVSQPALTVAIRKLEEELGGSLFDRDTRQLRLTELGKSMRTHLGRLQEAKNSARFEAEKILHNEMELIDVGVMCTVSPRLLSKGVADLQSQLSNAELVLHDVWGSKALELLLSGALDCALMACTAKLPDRFETYPLMQEKMVLATPPNHDFLQRSEIDLEELSDMPYVDRLRCEFRQKLFESLNNNELSVDAVISSEREDWMCDAIKVGMGVSIMPINTAIHAGLDYVEIKGQDFMRSIEIITVAGRAKSTSLQTLIDYFVAYDWPS